MNPPPPATCNLQPATLPVRRRNGKVASLPKTERDLVNQLLEDGAPYDAIVDAFTQRGFTLSSRNISNWFRGGYQDCLLLQQRLATHQLHEETALDILNYRDLDVTTAGLQIVATHLCQVLLALQPHRADPQSGLANYLRAANTLCRISRQLIQIQTFHGRHESDSDPRISPNNTNNEPPSVPPLGPCPVVPLASPCHQTPEHAAPAPTIPVDAAAPSPAQTAQPSLHVAGPGAQPRTTTVTHGNLRHLQRENTTMPAAGQAASQISLGPSTDRSSTQYLRTNERL